MNRFQLPIGVYTILFMIIGLGSVFFTYMGWLIVRLTTVKAQSPAFRFWESYIFMLWWPTQGVIMATIPILVMTGVVKMSLSESAGLPLENIPCSYEALDMGRMDDEMRKTCRNGRTGTCFLVSGFLMLLSGCKYVVPR